jgi:hypothetical protein
MKLRSTEVIPGYRKGFKMGDGSKVLIFESIPEAFPQSGTLKS